MFENEAALRKNNLKKSVLVVALPAHGRCQIKLDNAQLDPGFRLISKPWANQPRPAGREGLGRKKGERQKQIMRVACHKLKGLDMSTPVPQKIVFSTANTHGTRMGMPNIGNQENGVVFRHGY